MLKKIHHVGIVVRSIATAYAFYRDTLSLQVHKEDIIQDQGVKAALLTIGASEIELLEPITPGTGVARFLENRGYLTPFSSGTNTWRGAGLRFHADWIFGRGVRVSRFGVARPLNVSDHWPVWAEIEMERKLVACE